MPKVNPDDPELNFRGEWWEEEEEDYWNHGGLGDYDDYDDDYEPPKWYKDDVSIAQSITEYLINNGVVPSGTRDDNYIVVCGSLSIVVKELEIKVIETTPNPDKNAYSRWNQNEIDRITVADPDCYDKVLSYARKHKGS